MPDYFIPKPKRHNMSSWSATHTYITIDEVMQKSDDIKQFIIKKQKSEERRLQQIEQQKQEIAQLHETPVTKRVFKELDNSWRRKDPQTPRGKRFNN